MSDPGKIVFVDDQPWSTLRGTIDGLTGAGFQTVLVHPHELTERDLRGANLVLVDFLLEDRNWPERAELPFAARLQDGLALAGSLRAWLHQYTQDGGSPAAIALHSAELDQLSREIPLEIREHALARVHGLEWVFEKAKTDQTARLRERIILLAQAVQNVPATWPVDPQKADADLKNFLDLPRGPDTFGEAAWADVLDCHPPLHELSSASRGLAILRWLAQRILPYPCFLLDECQVALKLRVEPASLRVLLTNDDDDLAQQLGRAEYRGALACFDGRRWWRAGIDQLLWDVTDGQMFERETLVAALEASTSVELSFLETQNPVAVVNENYLSDGVRAASECVRLMLDDWPPYASDPWTTIEAAAEPAVAMRVAPDDRDRLE